MSTPTRCEWCSRFVARRDSYVTRWLAHAHTKEGTLRWRCVGRVLCPDCRRGAESPRPWWRVVGGPRG